MLESLHICKGGDVKAKNQFGLVAVLLALGFTCVSASENPVIEAARSADIKTLNNLLADGLDINTTQGDGATALHWAAHLENLEMVDLLIKQGADVNHTNDLGATPLWVGSVSGNELVISSLLQAGADPNLPLLSGETPLMTAARAGAVGAVEALLASGAEVDATENFKKQTALMWAIAQRHPAVVRSLVDAGADIYARTDSRPRRVNTETAGFGREVVIDIIQGGFTPLLFAARVGDLGSAQILVEAGADVNDVAPEGVSALVVAAHSGHGDVARFLLDRGADPNHADAGYTALQSAILRGDVDLLKALLQNGADPNEPLSKGTPARRASADWVISGHYIGATPLWLAAQFGEPEMMRILGENGSDPSFVMADGTTVLMATIRGRKRYAEGLVVDEADIEKNLLNGVKVAVNLGVDLQAVTTEGDTPLHAAALRKLNTVIEFLATKNIDINAKNNEEATPLMLASNPEGNSTAALLRTLGAVE